MRIAFAALAVLALAAGLSCQGRAGSPPPASNPLADPAWDDGKAEFSTYSGVTERYGAPRPTVAKLIVVKEDLDAITLVKSDRPPGPGRTIEGVKLNVIADFPTGTYTYHQMATLHFERASGRVLKETMSHTEGCGMTFVRVGPKGGRLIHEAHSYWDGEADREVEVNTGGRELVYADALPVWLRRWAALTQPFEAKLLLLPSQLSGRSPIASTRPAQVTLRFLGPEPLQVPAGSFTASRFAVSNGNGADVYWLDARPPHTLLRLDTATGRKLELVRTQRLDYWNHTGPGDEKLVE